MLAGSFFSKKFLTLKKRNQQLANMERKKRDVVLASLFGR
jgi:hypothetical protein